MNLTPQIESVLFVASAPLAMKKIARILEVDEQEVKAAIEVLSDSYMGHESGIHIVQSGDMVQMITNPRHRDVVEHFTKAEVSDELTRAQLETLTVIAYRGPITRPELEQIRGVNCAIILRNLLVRGLVVEKDSKEALMPSYEISIDALRFLGISGAEELPKYSELHAHAHIEGALEESNQ